ncbi:MAG: threonine synthase [Spirochaetales bacterium]|nr:threonine synthase [Spirochaetales bacterium]MCF7937736.1 threonine synthase [Spirochaetales bacterium]
MRFRSTRDQAPAADGTSFREAIFQGLAPDGGLYHPTSVPDLSRVYQEIGPETSFVELAAEMTAALFPEEFGRQGAREICEEAFPFEPAVRKVSEDIYILELFHGPSCAFKDFGASFLATSMEYFLEHPAAGTSSAAGSASSSESGHAVILTATSGDTGSAVARAFYGKDNIDVVILYPSGRVSPLQEQQLTTLGGNITALEVKGNFDDCQRMVKQAFTDPELRKRLPLTSANSINLGRLIPQAYYYIYGWTRPADLRAICVPSGNFGNLTAGIYAWTWGLPVSRFIAATNANDVVPEYLMSGDYSPRPSRQTLSNAMDVGDPSNFERMLAVFGGDSKAMAELIRGEAVSDEETLQTIARVRKDYGIFLDPHTAVGFLAAERYLESCRSAAGSSSDSADGGPVGRGRGSGGAGGDRQAAGSSSDSADGGPEGRGRGPAGAGGGPEAAGPNPVTGGTDAGPVLVLSTAHPGKFTETVEKATGEKPELPERLAKVLDLPKQAIPVENTLEALRSLLLERYG